MTKKINLEEMGIQEMSKDEKNLTHGGGWIDSLVGAIGIVGAGIVYVATLPIQIGAPGIVAGVNSVHP